MMLQISFTEDHFIENDTSIKSYVLGLTKALNSPQNTELTPEKLDDLITILCTIELFRVQRLLGFLENNFPKLHSSLIAKASENDFVEEEFRKQQYYECFIKRYIIFKRAEVITRVFAPERRDFIVKALEKLGNTHTFQILSAILNAVGCKFTLNGKHVPHNKIFSNMPIVPNDAELSPEIILPFILEHAGIVSSAALGHNSNIVGIFKGKDYTQIVSDPHMAPQSLLALFFLDVIMYLAESTAKNSNIDINSLYESNLKVLVPIAGLNEYNIATEVNMFQASFICSKSSFNSLPKLYNLDLKLLEKDINLIEILCGTQHKLASNTALEIIKDIIKVTEYPRFTLVTQDKDSFKNKTRGLIEAISGNIPEELQKPMDEPSYLDFNFDDLPNLPNLPNLPDLPDLEDVDPNKE